MKDGKIAIKRVKPKEMVCDCCLSRRDNVSKLYIYKLKNYGSTLKLRLCNCCLDDMFMLQKMAKDSKGEVFTNEYFENS